MWPSPIKIWGALAFLAIVGTILTGLYLLVDNLRASARSEGEAIVRAQVAQQDQQAAAEANKIAEDVQAERDKADVPGSVLRLKQNWCRDCKEAR